MATQIPCPHCGTLLALTEAYYDKQVRCRQCRQIFRAEAPPPPPPVPSPPPRPAAPPPMPPHTRRATDELSEPDQPPRPERRRPAERAERAPTPPKRNTKVLLAILFGVLFFGCGGLSLLGYMGYQWIDQKVARIKQLKEEQEQKENNNGPPNDGGGGFRREPPPPANGFAGGQAGRMAKLKDGQFVRPPLTKGLVGQMAVFSTEGDYIGQGNNYRYEAQQMTLQMQGNVLRIEVDGWNIEFAPERGQTLEVGVYRQAKRYPFNDDRPGINFSGKGRGCNRIAGDFVIWELELQAGQVARVAIDFVQRCEESMPPLYGTIRFNSMFEP